MHTLTLSFATLAELSAAVHALARGHTEPATNNGAWTDASFAKLSGDAPTATTPVKPKTAQKAAAPAASAEPAPSPAPAPAADAKPSAAAEKAVDYPTLQKAVFLLAGLVEKKGLEASVVTSIAKNHGSPTNFKALDPSTYAAALADVNAEIAKIEAMQEEVA